ncbi:MAG: hypothetical protein ABSD88_01475 [Candidatus Korobacteraceae bacterium]
MGINRAGEALAPQPQEWHLAPASAFSHGQMPLARLGGFPAAGGFCAASAWGWAARQRSGPSNH